MRDYSAALLAASLLCLMAGCSPRSSGLIGGVHVLDEAVVVEDRFYPISAVLRPGAATQSAISATGWLVPLVESGPWLVFYESRSALRNLRASKLDAARRLPKWVEDRVLSAVDVRSGQRFEVANTLDNNDDHILRMRVADAVLIAEVAPRFHVVSTVSEPRYFVFQLPSGPWQPLAARDARPVMASRRTRVAFEDLRAAPPPAAAPAKENQRPLRTRARWLRVTSFDQLSQAGLSEGDWGSLAQRKAGSVWETVYSPPGGSATIVALRQNDLGAAERQGLSGDRRPLP